MILSEDYLLRKIENSYFLLPVGQKAAAMEKVYEINESSYIILNELLVEKDIEELISSLVDAFEVSEDELPDFRKLIENSISEYVKSGIVVKNKDFFGNF